MLELLDELELLEELELLDELELLEEFVEGPVCDGARLDFLSPQALSAQNNTPLNKNTAIEHERSLWISFAI